MTSPIDGNTTPYVTALHKFRQSEQQIPVGELRKRGDTCPTPSQLIQFAAREITSETPRIETHAAECLYWWLVLQSITAMLHDEELTDCLEDSTAPLAGMA